MSAGEGHYDSNLLDQGSPTDRARFSQRLDRARHPHGGRDIADNERGPIRSRSGQPCGQGGVRVSAHDHAMHLAALGGVKSALDEILCQVRRDIEAFAEMATDASRMRRCADHLHQVQGTLRMLQSHAPVLVAEQMEQLAHAVQAGQVGDRDKACALLMRGVVLLSDYLQRLQDGHRDVPIVWLPLLNKIRAARGEPPLSARVLLALDTSCGQLTVVELEHARDSLSGRTSSETRPRHTADPATPDKTQWSAAGEEDRFHIATTSAFETCPGTAEAGTPVFLDSLLREILEAEVATQLDIVDAWLHASQLTPLAVTEPLLRALQTMTRAFAMTDVPEMSSVIGLAASYVQCALDATATPTAEAVETIAATASAIRATIDALQAKVPRIPVFADLRARLHALPLGEPPDVAQATSTTLQPVADADPYDRGPLDFLQTDSALVRSLVEEGEELLDLCDGLLDPLRLAAGPCGSLVGLRRHLHTLKRAARTAEIHAIGDLVHSLESLLEVLVASHAALTVEDLRLVECGFDRLRQLLVLTDEGRAVATPTDLIEALDARRRASDGGDSVAAMPLSASALLQPQADEDLPLREQREQVRVRADLLDRLVNQVDKVARYGATLEQQLNAFREATAEFDRTNVRLRDQLRRLDLEAEARILTSDPGKLEHDEHNVDPLEPDRVSSLQQLSQALNASVNELIGLQGVLDDLTYQYQNQLRQQSQISSQLQQELMRAHQVPFESLMPQLRRVVRQTAREIGRQAQLVLVLDQVDGELDRNLLDHMIAPLEHLLRNAVVHGLETPQVRRAAGKPEDGTITLRLHREGSEIVLEVSDDGAGLDREAICRRGEQRGLVGTDRALGEYELDALMFVSGLSTAEQVNQLAGRGGGLEVVRNEVRQFGGSVDVRSVPGRGATFTLRLPQIRTLT